jgi:chemotaxis signal transduction protein
VRDFIFGVDASQINEIVTTKHLELLIDPDDKYPFILVRHNKKPLPLFNILKQFRRCSHSSVSIPSLSFTFVTFHRAELLIACLVDNVEGFTSVSFASLKPVPEIITKATQKGCVWGFYEMSGTLVPLIDVAQVVTDQDITLYHEIRSSLSKL